MGLDSNLPNCEQISLKRKVMAGMKYTSENKIYLF